MFLRMIYDEGLAQAAYLLGCERSGEAIVIDPERDVERYIELAAADDLRIVAVAETHIHADFLSGSRELAERVGAKVYVSDEGGADWAYQWLDHKLGGGAYEHQLLRNGDTFSVGAIEFRATHTPGHTPEHISYVVTDRGGGVDAPIGVVTGDFLFVGDLGRPDLLETAAGHAGVMEPSARRLRTSVRVLDELPEFTQVWPGHGAGSACGKALGAVPMSTVGYEKRFNPAIAAAADERGFLEFVLAGQPEPPLYFARMKRLNQAGPPVLGRRSAPPTETLAQLRELDPARTPIVDTRPWDDFRAGHLPGSLSFPLIRSFCTDAGSMLDAEAALHVIADPQTLGDVMARLSRVGLDQISGWCDASELGEGVPGLTTIEEVDVPTAKALIERGEVAVIDVRRAGEFAEGHVSGALNLVHTRLAANIAEPPSDRPLLTICRTGKRSARAAALLRREGFATINLCGGMEAWAARNEAVVVTRTRG